MAITPEKISNLYAESGWTWKVDGNNIVPDPQDIRDLFSAMVDALDSRGGDQIEYDRLLIRKTQDNMDVYVHVGEIKEIIND